MCIDPTQQNISEIFYFRNFRNLLNGPHVNMSFAIENAKQNRMPFLNVNIIREDKIFRTSVNHKPLVDFIHISTTFCHLHIRLALVTNSLINASEYAQVRLNYALDYFF